MAESERPTPWAVTRATYTNRRYLRWVLPVWVLLALGAVGVVVGNQPMAVVCLFATVVLNIVLTQRVRAELAAAPAEKPAPDGQ